MEKEGGDGKGEAQCYASKQAFHEEVSRPMIEQELFLTRNGESERLVVIIQSLQVGPPRN